MTSKISLNRFGLKETVRKSWIYIVLFIIMFMAEPFFLLMDIDMYELNTYLTREELLDNIRNFVIHNYGFGGVLLAFAAVAIALFVFSYLYMKSAVDLYHSAPISRKKLYVTKYLTGIVPVVLIQLICGLFSTAVLAGKGYLTNGIGGHLWVSTLVSIVIFALFYNVTIIAIMLTGNVVVGFFGTVALLFFVPAFEMVLRQYYASCLQTYYYNSPVRHEILYALIKPIRIFNVAPVSGDFNTAAFVAIVIETVAFAIIGYFLYKVRPSEATGKSLCYNIIKPIVRVLLLVLAMLAFSMMVFAISSGLDVVWYWLVFVIVGLVAYALLEFVFELDFRGLLKNVWQFGAAFVIAAVISLIFQYDVFNYDRFLPKDDEVESISVKIDNVEQQISRFELADEVNSKWEYVYDDSDYFKKYLIDNNADGLELGKCGIVALNPTRNAFKRNRDMYFGEEPYDPSAEKNNSYVICYHLKNGKDVYRSYNASINETYEATAHIYESSAFKNYKYQVDDFKATGAIKRIDAYNGLSDLVFTSQDVETDRFLAAYSQDLENRKFDDLKEIPYIYLSTYDNKTYYDLMYGYCIYPSDKNTLAYLKEAGVDMDKIEGKIPYDEITKVTVYDYDNFDEETGMTEETVLDPEKDKATIQKLMEVGIPQQMINYNSMLIPTENMDFYVEYRAGNGGTYFSLRAGTVIPGIN